MLSRLILAVGTWVPPKGYELIQADCQHYLITGMFTLAITLKRQGDQSSVTLKHEATLAITGSQLRELLPDPTAEVHKKLTDMFYVLQR